MEFLFFLKISNTGLCTNRPSPPLKNGVSRNRVSVVEAVLILKREAVVRFDFGSKRGNTFPLA